MTLLDALPENVSGVRETVAKTLGIGADNARVLRHSAAAGSVARPRRRLRDLPMTLDKLL